MTNEAADKVKQIREYLSKMTPGPWCNPSPLYDEIYQFDQHKHIGRMVSTDDAKGIASLRTDAEWLLSQLSASEERVRALEKGLGACIEQLKWNWLCEAGRNGLRMTYPELVEKYGKNKTIELAESLLPSPPQVIRG